MTTAGLLAAATFGLGCSRRESTPELPPASEEPAAPASSGASSGEALSSDLELVGDPTVAGALATDTLLRDARLLIAPLRRCTSAMPENHTFDLVLAVDDVGLLRDVRYRPEQPADAGIEGCIRDALVRSRVSHSLESGARAEVTLRFRAIARAGGISVDPTRTCRSDDDCVFVHGDCSQPFVVHRAHAAEIDAASRRRMAAATCSAGAVGAADAHRVACVQGVCESLDETHADLRRCSTDARCVTLVLEGGRFTAVAKQSVSDAAEQLRARRPLATEEAPAPSCVYGVCSLDWAGSR